MKKSHKIIAGSLLSFLAIFLLYKNTLIEQINSLKNRLLFHPDRGHFLDKPSMEIDDFIVHGREMNILQCWFYSPSKKTNMASEKIILFSHGNAGNLTYRQTFAKKCLENKHAFLLFDYRGFGGSCGFSTIDTIVDDMEDCYKSLLNMGYKKENIIAMGESIGSFPASQLAAKFQLSKLVILYGLHSLSETVHHLLPTISYFIRFFIQNDLRVDQNLSIFKGQTLLLHSKSDKIVSYNNALLNLQINDRTKLIDITGGHNTHVINWSDIFSFISLP